MKNRYVFVDMGHSHSGCLVLEKVASNWEILHEGFIRFPRPLNEGADFFQVNFDFWKSTIGKILPKFKIDGVHLLISDNFFEQELRTLNSDWDNRTPAEIQELLVLQQREKSGKKEPILLQHIRLTQYEETDSNRIFVKSIPVSIVAGIEKICQALGVDLFSLDSALTNNLNYAIRQHHRQMVTGCGLLLHVGYSQSYLVLLRKGVPEELRICKIGGKHFTQNIADAFGISYNDAEDQKITESYVPDDPDDGEVAKLFYEKLEKIQKSPLALVQEVDNCVDLWMGNERFETLKFFYLTGGGGRFRILHHFLKESNRGIKALTPDPGLFFESRLNRGWAFLPSIGHWTDEIGAGEVLNAQV